MIDNIEPNSLSDITASYFKAICTQPALEQMTVAAGLAIPPFTILLLANYSHSQSKPSPTRLAPRPLPSPSAEGESAGTKESTMLPRPECQVQCSFSLGFGKRP